MRNLNKHRTMFVNISLKFIVSPTSLYLRFGKPIEGDDFMACSWSLSSRRDSPWALLT